MLLVRSLIVLLLLLIPQVGVSKASRTTHVYREVTGDSRREFRWQLQEDHNRVIITAQDTQESFVNICTRDGSTLHWTVESDNDTNLCAERVRNTIRLSGRFKGKDVEKSFTIDDRPWYQPLSYSLRHLACSQDNTMSFWTIRLDTLELVDMKATRGEIESLVIGRETMQARKVEIRQNGYLSFFWSANYWFRTSDCTFVQYRGTHGLPGTDETTVSLFRSQPTGTPHRDTEYSAWPESAIKK